MINVKLRSAGIIVYRLVSATDGDCAEVLLGHLGGPFWAKRHEGAWSFPKGLLEGDEDPFVGALREFREELGFSVPGSPSRLSAIDLGVVQASSKQIQLFAVSGDPDLAEFVPGSFEMEWPPKSGRLVSFPEIDRVAWIRLGDASELLSAGQRPFVDRLQALIN